ncbi:MAG TPA: hypothetical protein VL727_18330, partial [Puia sp.]|nr:hypothetical protein [Puia sp.]
MDKQLLLERLQKLTGTLSATGTTGIADLKTLHRKLAEQLIHNPDLVISGTQLAHEETQADPVLSRFDHLSDLLDEATAAAATTTASATLTTAAAPLIFRRETAFRNNLLGNSVPSWGTGLAPAESFGPFLDEQGLTVWFDLFHPTRLVKVFIQGEAQPVLLIPVWGTLTGRKSYRIEAGSVWIASHLIARTALLNGYYTGLKITGGMLDLTIDAVINGETILIPPSATGTLQLDLKQNIVTDPSPDAGFDATAATVQLPRNVSVQFNSLASTIQAADSSCTVLANDTRLKFRNSAPIWIDFLSQILVPYSASTNSDTPDTFQVGSSASKLCTLAGTAKYDTNTGWLLPAAKVDPSQLGEAAGTGSLCIGLQKGISASWKGLKGGRTNLIHPAIIVEPGMLTGIDFFAENTAARQKWTLWQNSGSAHHSDITLAFGKTFPFIFVSASKGTEQVTFFCNYKAALDKPVDANGNPFNISSTIALGGVIQTGTTFRILLLDTDLLFDGNAANPAASKRYSIALRNALFNVSSPYSLFLSGDLKDTNTVTKGSLSLMFAIRLYLPTLPDPYVASYTAYLRDPAGLRSGLGKMALAAFVKWPDPAAVANAGDNAGDPAYLYFRFAPLNLPTPPPQRAANGLPVSRNFQTGVSVFNQNIAASRPVEKDALPLPVAVAAINPLAPAGVRAASLTATAAPVASASQLAADFTKISQQPDPADLSVIDKLRTHPLLSNIKDLDLQLSAVERAAIQNRNQSPNTTLAAAYSANDNPNTFSGKRGSFFADTFLLLDVSSNADQMGISFGPAIEVDRQENGNVNLRPRDEQAGIAAAYQSPALPLQILNMDVVATGLNVRAVTLPQISWEPVFNVPLPQPQGGVPYDDLITYTPGLVVYENDGIPTHIYSESPYLVPLAPLPVTRHFIKEYNDKNNPRQLHSTFTLPFALVAMAHFNRNTKVSEENNASLHFHMPWFDKLRGGLQIHAEAPPSGLAEQSNTFTGQTIQIDNNLRWFLLGYQLTGSTLGRDVRDIFNKVFDKPSGGVPLERIDFSGYGASIFSNWLNGAAAIADVSQAKFDVLMGRTAHEVIQVRSVMYMCTGIVHVVRTITLMRSPNGYVFRSDSGWKAESDAFYNCDYNIRFGTQLLPVTKPYVFHPGAIKGVSNVREINTYPPGGTFTSSFSLNESGLPAKLGKINPSDWNFIKDGISFSEQLPVLLQAVVFDGDVHMDDVTSGGTPVGGGEYIVQSKKRLGYVQISPTGILIPPRLYAELLTFQNGSLGGPLDSIIDISGSGQKMRISRADINPGLDAAGQHIFVSAARGSLILPKDGSWSVVRQNTDTGDVNPVEEGQTVPLIRAEGAANYRIANPADVVVTNASKINYGVLQSTGTQKLLFDIPQFAPGVKKLLSNETYFADAYKLLNSKGPFPNIANALQLTNAEKQVDILGEGLMKMADRKLHLENLLSNFQYPFIDEPDILKVYADYKNKNGKGELDLGIDSNAAAAADKWKAALSNIRIVVDLG